MKKFFKGKPFKGILLIEGILLIALVLVAAALILFGFRSCNMNKKKTTEKPKIIQVDKRQKQIDSLKTALAITQQQLLDCQKNCNQKAPAKITKKPIRKKTKKVIPKVKTQAPVVVEVVKAPENVELKLPRKSTLEKINVPVETPKKTVTKTILREEEPEKNPQKDCPTCPRRYGTIEFHY